MRIVKILQIKKNAPKYFAVLQLLLNFAAKYMLI